MPLIYKIGGKFSVSIKNAKELSALDGGDRKIGKWQRGQTLHLSTSVDQSQEIPQRDAVCSQDVQRQLHVLPALVPVTGDAALVGVLGPAPRGRSHCLTKSLSYKKCTVAYFESRLRTALMVESVQKDPLNFQK